MLRGLTLPRSSAPEDPTGTASLQACVRIEPASTLPPEAAWRLFHAVGWIAPRAKKPIRHRRIDSIANHTVHLDGPHEAAFLTEPFRNSQAVYLAWIGQEIVGCVRVLSDRIQRSVIYDLIVHPDHQGKGIGKRLVERCIRDFAHTQITLGTASATVPFYARLGFEPSPNYLELPTESY